MIWSTIYGDTIYIYTSTGFGPRKSKKAQKHFLGVYANCQICSKHTRRAFGAPPQGRSVPPVWGVLFHMSAVCIYTRELYTPASFVFVLGANPVVL